MSKLLKLSGFVTIDAAADYLSKEIEEHVSLAELYQLVLNNDLVISARLDTGEKALLGQYIPFTSQEFFELSQNNQVPEEWKWIDSEQIYFDDKLKRFYAFNSEIKEITGCWDFTMLGSETKVIDHYYRIQATKSVGGGLSGIELNIPREGILLTNGNQLARLQSENELNKHIIFDYFLNKLVFKKSELNRFIESLGDKTLIVVDDKPLGSKERNTLYCLIGALCKRFFYV